MKNRTFEPTQLENTAVYAANFRKFLKLARESMPTGTSHEFRILKFGRKQRLIAQIKKKIRIVKIYRYYIGEKTLQIYICSSLHTK